MSLLPIAQLGQTAYNLWQNLPGGTQGTWGNLKDRGVTEWAGNVLGTSNTALQPSGPGGAYPQKPSGPGGAYPQAPTGGSGEQYPETEPTSPDDPNAPSGDDLLRKGYDDYFGYLDSLYGGLDQQKASQEQVAQNTYNTGLNTLTNQYDTSKGQIESQQTKSLRDLEDSMRLMWQQGNSYLGTRGASDSSAANMYSYALTKEGSKQRGDLMGDYSMRLQNLKSAFDTESKNLQNSLSTKISEINQWYIDAQNQIKGMRADAQRQYSNDALNYAMQLASQAQQQYANQKNVLDSWAAQKATSFQQLQQMLAQNAQNMPSFTQLFANPRYTNTASTGLYGYGTTNDEQKRLV